MVELELLGVSQADDRPSYPVVLLRHESRVLPILVGAAEASAIHIGMTGEKTARPMTHDLIRNILAGLRGVLQSVVIYKLENETFYAHLNIEQQDLNGDTLQVLRIDTRPSDGIAIAVRTGCPIFAADEVMENAQDAAIFSSDDDEDEDEPEEDLA